MSLCNRFIASALTALCGVTGPSFAVAMLQADFDTATLDAPVGTGGAAAGEPVSVSSSIDAIVRADPFCTPGLEITDDSTMTAGFARFEFLGGTEVTSGTFTISAELWFEEFDDYGLYVREQGSSADSFATLRFSSTGSVWLSDADSSSVVIGTYDIGRAYPVSLVFHMSAGRYDVYLDGCLAVNNEPHGVTGSGVGAVLFGMEYDTDLAGRFSVDDISVVDGQHPLGLCAYDCAAEADFDDKIINAPIGTGGPAFGEPVSVSTALTAIVRAIPFSTPSLELDDDSSVTAGSARFEFLNRFEVATGIISIRATLWFESFDNYFLSLRERDTSALQFGDLTFASSGYVWAGDEDTPALGIVGSYDTGRPYPVRLVYDMDAGTYDVYLDGSLVVEDEPHGVSGCGIGAVLFGTGFDTDLAGRFFVDDFSVCEGGCLGDTNGDDVVDVDDLNNVLLDWGTDGSAHGGDVTGTPPGGLLDGIVTIDDLIAVIINWGPCP